jgi:hypothetical protein
MEGSFGMVRPKWLMRYLSNLYGKVTCGGALLQTIVM